MSSAGRPDDHRERRREVRALLTLDALPDVGPATVRRLVRVFGSARAALFASARRFAAVAGRVAAGARSDPRIGASVEAALARAEQLGMEIVVLGDAGYPPDLLNLADPPTLLFLRGRSELLSRRGVAVVGSRRCTARARDVATRLGRALARAGVPVVSGLALGVDGAAHRGAVETEGPTVAVLGCGADRPYPRSHARLFRSVLEHGLVVSEFMPGTDPLPHHFPRRNRVLAGLSRTVVVVEAGRRSGALITVDHALDLGLDVYAVPGPIDHPACEGSNRLLLDGARPLVSIDWFMAEIVGEGAVSAAPGRVVPDGDAGRILSALEGGAIHVDEVAHRLGLDVGSTLALLSELEVEGRVEQAPGMRFRLAG